MIFDIVEKELAVISPSKAKQLRDVYTPMIAKLSDFEKKFKDVMALKQDNIKIARAKELRLEISQVRIRADKVRKKLKEEYTRANKAIQGVYNQLEWAVADKEKALKEVEDTPKRIAAEQVAKLHNIRAAELAKYDTAIISGELGVMTPEAWEEYLKGAELNYKKRLEIEKKQEEERIAEEKKRKEMQEENARLNAENKRLKEKRRETEKKQEEERIAKEKNNCLSILKDDDGYEFIDEKDMVWVLPYLVKEDSFLLRKEPVPPYMHKRDIDRNYCTVISETIEEGEEPTDALARALIEEAGLVLHTGMVHSPLHVIPIMKTTSARAWIYFIEAYEYTLKEPTMDGSEIEKKSSTFRMHRNHVKRNIFNSTNHDFIVESLLRRYMSMKHIEKTQRWKPFGYSDEHK